MLAVEPASNVNLLIGLLALDNELISRADLVAAVRQWVQGRSQTLSAILVQRGAMRADGREIVEAIAGGLLERHGGDVEQAIMTVDCLRTVRVALQGVADEDLQSCLARVSVAPATTGGPVSAATHRPAPVAAPTTMPASPPASAPPSSRFRVERLLAEGALGSVFLARDEELHRDVAIKQIHARLADDVEAQARFDREVKYAAELQHTGIVPIYGAGRYPDGSRYYAMRLIKGENMRAAIDRCHQKPDPARMKEVRALVPRFVTICRAIAYAHQRGVLHRDIKPENVMLSEDGETLVVDWGLAKSASTSSGTDAPEGTLANQVKKDYNPTQQFQAIGTLAYMSPETAGGELDRVGPRSDVFSLGATLYHLLTGQAPFTKSGASREPLLSKVQRGDFPKPRRVWPEVPRPLEAVCIKAMAMLPDNRYQSAAALADDLDRWLIGEPVSVLSESWSGRTMRRLQRRPLRAMAMTGIVAAVVCGAAGAVGVHLLRPPETGGDSDAPALRAELQEKASALVKVESSLQETQLARDKNAQALKARDVELLSRDAALAALTKKYNAVQPSLDAKEAELAKAKRDRESAEKASASLKEKHDKELKQLTDTMEQRLAKHESIKEEVKRRLQVQDTFFDDMRKQFVLHMTASRDAFDAFATALKDKTKRMDASKRLAILGRSDGDMWTLLEKHEAAEVEYRGAIDVLKELHKQASKAAEADIADELAVARHNLAWLLATSADVPKRKPEEAVELAKEALDRQPDRDTFRLTYGISLFRNGDFVRAVEELKKAQKKLPVNKADDYDFDTSLLFLAMAEYRLNHRKDAAMWLAQAQDHLAGRRKVSRELDRFRKEAEDLIVVQKKGQ
jgi:tetratricopeptide (TPR) repeat protein